MNRQLRSAGVWLAATAATSGGAGWLLADLARHSTDKTATAPGFETLLVTGCQAAAAVCLAWLWVLVSLVALDAAHGRQRRRAGVPPVLRRVVLAACGAGLAVGVAAPANAGTDGPPASPLLGLPVPDRTTSPGWTDHLPSATPTRGSVTRAVSSRVVVVAPGDSLWSLAAADLPPGAPVDLVDAHWRAIHAANRALIGDDPDLIHPGMRLRLPAIPDSEPST